MLDKLRAMAVFAKTVEAGSFRGAAKQLGLSASVVSHHVSQLEAALDVVLLYRSTRRIALTADGEKLFDAAQGMLAAAEVGLSAVAVDAKSPSGKLCVAAPAVFVGGALMDDLAAFVRAFPNVELTLCFSDAPLDIMGGGIDVAIRAGALQDSSYKSKKLFTMPRKLVAAPQLVASHGAPARPEELASWEWLRLKSRPPNAHFLDAAGKTVEVGFKARVVADSAEALVQLALRGLGLAMVPAFNVAGALKAKQLVEVLPRFKLETPTAFAVWPANAPKSGLTRRLVSFLEERAEQRA
jgi:DNA-binding transcriptional LysR family regulator